MERYCDAWLYSTAAQGVSIRELPITVTVWRALTKDEKTEEVVARATVRLGHKSPSPSEAITWYDAQRATSSQQPSGAAAPIVTDSVAQHWVTSRLSTYQGSTDIEKLLSYCNGPGVLFVRPPQDRFVDARELDVDGLTEPLQERTPLHVSQARRYVNDHDYPSPMFICFACGEAVPASTNTNKSVEWKGTEHVLCSLRELEELQFSAKPSLGTVHTALVNERYVYSYRVDVQEKEATKPETKPGEQETPQEEGRKHKHRHRLGSTEDVPQERRSMAAESPAAPMAALPASLPASPTKNERLRLLEQALLARTSHDATRSSAQSDFAPPPALATDMRVHVMGTLEHAVGFTSGSLFLRFHWILPAVGCEIDKDINVKCGVVHASSGVSQIAFPSQMWNEDDLMESMYSFNLPFELHCTVNTAQCDVMPLRLVVEAFSGADGEEHQALEGYGLLSIAADRAGNFESSCDCWAPAMTGREELRAMFVGGAPSLTDIDDVAVPNRVADGMHCRGGLFTRCGGRIFGRWSTLLHGRTLVKSSAANVELEEPTATEAEK